MEYIKPELDEIKQEIMEQEMEANMDQEVKVKMEPSDYAYDEESYEAKYAEGYDNYPHDEIK